MDHNQTGSLISLAPQGGVDSFGTPPGRSMTHRFNEPSFVYDDPNRYRAPVPMPPFPNQPTFEVRTWWQTTIWAAIVAGVILGLIFL